MAGKEGVIQYRLEYQQGSLPEGVSIDLVESWRLVFYHLNMVGQQADRYHGLGFGNLSARPSGHDEGFLITGSQTGHLPLLRPEHYAWVYRWNSAENTLVGGGGCKPSSESLTHGAIYDAHPQIRAVIHVHEPLIWQQAEALNIPQTRPGIGYGTTGMCQEVTRLFPPKQRVESGLFVMSGHEDGVIAFGPTMAEAADLLLRVYHQARRRYRAGS